MLFRSMVEISAVGHVEALRQRYAHLPTPRSAHHPSSAVVHLVPPRAEPRREIIPRCRSSLDQCSLEPSLVLLRDRRSAGIVKGPRRPPTIICGVCIYHFPAQCALHVAPRPAGHLVLQPFPASSTLISGRIHLMEGFALSPMFSIPLCAPPPHSPRSDRRTHCCRPCRSRRVPCLFSPIQHVKERGDKSKSLLRRSIMRYSCFA